MWTRRGSCGRRTPRRTHQQRRVALDAETVEVLRDQLARCEERASAIAMSLSRDRYVFSPDSDGGTPLVPDTATLRFSRMAFRLGITTNLHALRHYSATGLIAAGVDVRTVAGRLGHGGGGATTLRVYAAWLSESDQRAAASLMARMPERPGRVGPSS
ncbi:tyrosine-type recombinase/integrase [Micromonospora sp. NPDC005197]|uniref:tyrosine-type recombinase/integrase n=1 Tax=Micromonospora sp. NPDC005197 TaxID=3157020 RepID=UPI0033AF8E8F